MKVNNALTLVLVSLSLSFTACQNSKTNPAADYKNLENAVPPGEKPVLRQDGVDQLYIIKPSGPFEFKAGEKKSVNFQVEVVKGIQYSVSGSSMPEGMKVEAVNAAKGEYAVTWTATNQILASNGSKGTFYIHVTPTKGSDATVLAKWQNANYIEQKEYAWSATRASITPSAPAANKQTTAAAPAAAPAAKLGKVITVGATEVTFKAGEESAAFITFKGENGAVKIDTDKINRVDFSVLAGKPTITCNEVAKQAFVQECKIFWAAACDVKDKYSFKIPVASSLGTQKTETVFDYVIKFDKNTNTCKPAAKSAGTPK